MNQAVFDSIYNDPARDDYHYYRGSDWDQMKAPILYRYKFINNPQGNSPDSDSRTESYDISYKSTPDVEDINQDFTLNEYEKYYQYHVSILPEYLWWDTTLSWTSVVHSQTATIPRKPTVNWYQFRIPVDQYETKEGKINDFTCIRFMRMFLHQLPEAYRSEIRYPRPGTGRVEIGRPAAQRSQLRQDGSQRREHRGECREAPVNYVLASGVQREQDPTQPQLIESNEQSLKSGDQEPELTGEAKAE